MLINLGLTTNTYTRSGIDLGVIETFDATA